MRFLRRSLIALSILLTSALLFHWSTGYNTLLWHHFRGKGAILTMRGKLVYFNEVMATDIVLENWDPSSFTNSPSASLLRQRPPKPTTGTIQEQWSVTFLEQLALGRSHFLGFAYTDYGTGDIAIAVPYWFLALITSIPAILWLRPPRGKRPGLCPTCNYDLRASKTRCPECGTPIPPVTSPTPARP